MFVNLTNRQGHRIAVNMDNIVQIETQELAAGEMTTSLTSNFAQANMWHVIQVNETLDQIRALMSRGTFVSDENDD